VKTRAVSARDVAEAAIARIEAEDGRLNAFTDPTFDGALEEADAVDGGTSTTLRVVPVPPLGRGGLTWPRSSIITQGASGKHRTSCRPQPRGAFAALLGSNQR